MRYDKLVRDKIPEIIAKNGGTPKGRFLSDDKEYWEKLKEKLQEELKEFREAKTPDQQAEEFADILEVLDAMFDFLGFSKEYIEDIKKKKAKERGQFKKRILLESD